MAVGHGLQGGIFPIGIARFSHHQINPEVSRKDQLRRKALQKGAQLGNLPWIGGGHQ